MGLIKAITGSVGGTFADQWREFFYCEALDADTLVCKGQKRTSGRSSNKKGEENVISNGARIAVADGQCMIIVQQGAIVELCAEPGEFDWDASIQPSVFTGNLGDSVMASLAQMGERFTFGGNAGQDQRVYYINTKEILGNKYGTANPVPFRVVDRNIGLDVDISVRCNGEYSYRIVDPVLFYRNVCGNVTDAYYRSEIDSQLKSELLTALQPAFAKISAKGVRYSEVPAHAAELADALNDELDVKWAKQRGIVVESFGMNSITAPPEDVEMIKRLQSSAVLRDPTMAAASLTAAQGDAMRAAAANEGGAMAGFMGMGMAQGMGGMNAQSLYAMGAAQQAPAPAAAPAAGGWTCACGAVNTGRFCGECGAAKPASATAWTCSCGATNTGKFCGECGSPRPAPTGPWTCSCGTANTGKFCGECGNPRA